MNGQNLDQLCAQFGYEMCRAVGDAFKTKEDKVDKARTENHITKSLAVLQEDGVYAFFLYQQSRGEREKKGAEALQKQAHALLAEQFAVFKDEQDSMVAVRGNKQKNRRGLAENLDELLLAKRLLEQALIYARYHAKALG